MLSPFDPAIPPGRQGFRLPAEWEPHAATWLAWPHKEASWPGRLERIPPLFVEMVRQLAPGEHVHLNLNDAAMETEVRERLQAAGVAATDYTLHQIPTNDAWARDHGPMFLVRDHGGRREQVILDWGYNAWGGKYPPFDLDDVVPTRVAQELGLPVVAPGIIMEGGSLDGDGRGTLLTSESCLLHPNRNPQLDRQAIETYLGDYLGARKVLWLGEGIEGDDTDGHIDDLTRFVAPNTVVTVVEDDPADANFQPLRANLLRLQHMSDADGYPLRIYQLPMPAPLEYDGQRVPASYANFYIGNEVVLLPTFACPADARARAILEVLFPTRRVLGIDCRDLIWGLGAFHCVTQQQPALIP